MSAAVANSPADEAADALALAVSCAEAVRDAPLYRFSRDEQLVVGRELERLGRCVYAAQIAWVREMQNSGVAAELSYSSTRAFLKDVLLIGSGDAADRVRAATMTLPGEPLSGGEIPARLPMVGAALMNGELGAGQVSVITRAVTGWPRDLDQDTFDICEQVLVEQGKQTDPRALTLIAQQIEQRIDPDGTGPDNDPDPVSRMELKLGVRDPRTGLTRITGTLCDEAVEAFRQATDALSAPRPEVDGIKDARTPGQRLAQAHLAVIRGYLDAGQGPTTGGQVPHVTMTISYDALTGALSGACLDHGGPIDPGTARRLLCDAEILPVVLGSDAEVLDVGRTQRTFPRHLRRALAVREGGCAWPGCDRPVGWCQAHHVQWWVRGGRTSLINGALVCEFHHREIHKGEWTMRMGADGRPEFIPPVHIDPDRLPRRNHRVMVQRT